MTILEMISEWKRGCSDASPEAPELCPQCTRGLIDAIERSERTRLHGSSGAGGDGIISQEYLGNGRYRAILDSRQKDTDSEDLDVEWNNR